MTTSRGEARIEHRLSEGIPPPPTGASLPPEIVMRKGHAPFVFSACLVALVALAAVAERRRQPRPSARGGGRQFGRRKHRRKRRRVRASSTAGAADVVGKGSSREELARASCSTPRLLATCSIPTVPRRCPPTTIRARRRRLAPTRAADAPVSTKAHDGGRTWHCQEFPQRDGGYMTCESGTANGTGCESKESSARTGMPDRDGCFTWPINPRSGDRANGLVLV